MRNQERNVLYCQAYLLVRTLFIHAFCHRSSVLLITYAASRDTYFHSLVKAVVQARRVDLRSPWRMLLSVGDICLDVLLLEASPPLAVACC